MKKTSKHNNFSPETHFMFMDDNYWECWFCGMNTADAGHHIFGRGKEEGSEKSPLNYAPLCNGKCHLQNHGYLMTSEGKRKMLDKTIGLLSSREYVLNDIDNNFLEKYGLEITRLGLKI